jgi:hypothetical protein
MNHLECAHILWKQVVQPGDTLVDATCGNGHDTFFLSKLQPARLYAIDIQSTALEATRKRLELSEVHLIQGCHSHFPKEIAPETVKLIVYNLGYLPGGNKSITTCSNTSLESIQKALSLILPGGLISITCYPGHEEGAKEEELLLKFAAELDKELWCVTHQRWINRRKAPSLLLLQKISRQTEPHNRESDG